MTRTRISRPRSRYERLMSLTIRRARPERGEASCSALKVRELAEYEKLLHEVRATEADIAEALFGEDPRLFLRHRGVER